MTRGARNIHALAVTLRRLEHEAATGTCSLLTCDKPAIGFVSSWDNHPRGICADHASTAPRHGYTVHLDPDSNAAVTPTEVAP